MYRDSSLSGEGIAGAAASLSLGLVEVIAEAEQGWLADARLPRDWQSSRLLDVS